jgi:hypothetical protein
MGLGCEEVRGAIPSVALTVMSAGADMDLMSSRQ